MRAKSSPSPDARADAGDDPGSATIMRSQIPRPESSPPETDDGATDPTSTSSPHFMARIHPTSDSSPTILLPSKDCDPAAVPPKTAGGVDDDDDLSDPPEFESTADETEDDESISVDAPVSVTSNPAAELKPLDVVQPVPNRPEEEEDDDAYEDIEAEMEQDEIGSGDEDDMIQFVGETPAPTPLTPPLPPFLNLPNETDSQFQNRMNALRRMFSARNSPVQDKYRWACEVNAALNQLLAANIAFNHMRSQHFVLRTVPEVAARLSRERPYFMPPFTGLIDQIVGKTLILFTRVPDQLVHDSTALIRVVHRLLEEDQLDESDDDDMNEMDDFTHRIELLHDFMFNYHGLEAIDRYASNPGLPFDQFRLLYEIASSCQTSVTPARPPYATDEMMAEAFQDQQMLDAVGQLLHDLSQCVTRRVQLLGRSDEDIKAVDRRQFSDLLEVVEVIHRQAAIPLKKTIVSVCLACSVLDKRLYGLSLLRDLINLMSAPSPEVVAQMTAAFSTPPAAPSLLSPGANTHVTPVAPQASPMVGPQLPAQVPRSSAAAIAAQATQSAQLALASLMTNYRPEFGSPQDLTAADLAHWLLSENIMDRLFVRNVHLELVQRSGDVVSFLLRRSVITNSDMTPVWLLLGPTHHATMRTAAARVLGECASNMPIEMLQASVGRVRDMDANGIDEAVVSMVQQMVRAILEYRKESITEGQQQYHLYLQQFEQYQQALAAVATTSSQEQHHRALPRLLSPDEHHGLIQHTVGESLDLIWNLVRDSSHLPTFKRLELVWWLENTIRNSPILTGDDLTPLMVSALGELQMHQSAVPACIVLRALVQNGTLDDADTRAMIRANVVEDFVSLSKDVHWDPTFSIEDEFQARANLLHVLVSPMLSDGGSGAGVSRMSVDADESNQPLTREEGVTLWDALAPSPLLQQTFFGYLKWIIEATEPNSRPENRSVVARLVIDGVRDRLAIAASRNGGDVSGADGSELVSEPLMQLVREAIVYVAVEEGEMTPEKTVVKPVANEDLVWQILVGGAAAAGPSAPGSPMSPSMNSATSMSSRTLAVDQTVVQNAAQFIVSLSLQGSPEYLATSVEPFVTRVIARLGQTNDARAFRSILQVLQMYMAQFQARFPKAVVATPGDGAGQDAAALAMGKLPHKSMLGAVKPLHLSIRLNGSELPPSSAAATAAKERLDIEMPGLSTVGMLRSKLVALFEVTDDPGRLRTFARGKELTANAPSSQLLTEMGIEDRDAVQVMVRPPLTVKTTPPPAEGSNKTNLADSPDSEMLKALQVSNNNDADPMDEGTPMSTTPPPAPPAIPSPQALLTRPELFSQIMHLLSFSDQRGWLVYQFLQELPTLPSLANQLTPAGAMSASELLNPAMPYRYLYTLEVLQIAALQQGYDPSWRASMRARGILRTVANNLVVLDQSELAGRQCLLASLTVLGTTTQELADDPDVQVESIEAFMCQTITSGSHADTVCQCLKFLFLLVSMRPEASAGSDVCAVVHGVLTSAEPKVRLFACEQLMVATALPMDLVTYLWSLVDVGGMPSELYAILNHFLETPLAISVRSSPDTVNRLFESVHNNPTAPKLGLLANLLAPGCAPSDDAMCDFGQQLYMNMYPTDWHQDPPISNSGVRDAAHRVIASMCRVSTALAAFIANQLNQLLIHDAVFFQRFDYNPKACIRRTFVGLVNQGATCYQNSLLQQFFMDRAFRRGILECKPLPQVLAEANGGGDAKPAGGKEKKRKKRGSTIFALQRLFAHLQESQDQYVDTTSFINTLRTADGEEINPFVQMDVDEFYNQLFDRLESEIKGTPQVALLDQRYGGRLVHMIESNECGHVSSREEPYHALQCEVKGRHSLEESLAHYVQGESLSGDNKYRCSTCNNLVDAVKSTRVGTLPTNLLFHLKRFEFDMEFFYRIKINDRFEFPPSIDMRPYLAPAARNAAPGSAADPGETVFDLTGVLVHMGTSESGHYYSFIRDVETHEWFQFNDTIVSHFDPDQLPEEAYGGGKANSAYMLVYRRRGTADNPAAEQAAAKAAIPQDLIVDIHEHNAHLRSEVYLFDPPLGHLALALGQMDPSRWMQTVVLYYLRVAVRGTDRTILKQLSSFITEAIDTSTANWFLAFFVQVKSPWASIAHNVIDPPSPDIRADLANTLSVVIRERATDLAVRQFAGVMSHTFHQVELRKWWRTCDQVFFLALAVCDRVPDAFINNLNKLIHTVTSDWDSSRNQGVASIAAICKAHLRPLNLLILRTAAGSEVPQACDELCVRNNHHQCPYLHQLVHYCHEWPEFLPLLADIARKFNAAEKIMAGLIGVMKSCQTEELQQYLLSAVMQVATVSNLSDRQHALEWLKWVAEGDSKDFSDTVALAVLTALSSLAKAFPDVLPFIQHSCRTWACLMTEPSFKVRQAAAHFFHDISLAPHVEVDCILGFMPIRADVNPSSLERRDCMLHRLLMLARPDLIPPEKAQAIVETVAKSFACVKSMVAFKSSKAVCELIITIIQRFPENLRLRRASTILLSRSLVDRAEPGPEMDAFIFAFTQLYWLMSVGAATVEEHAKPLAQFCVQVFWTQKVSTGVLLGFAVIVSGYYRVSPRFVSAFWERVRVTPPALTGQIIYLLEVLVSTLPFPPYGYLASVPLLMPIIDKCAIPNAEGLHPRLWSATALLVESCSHVPGSPIRLPQETLNKLVEVTKFPNDFQVLVFSLYYIMQLANERITLPLSQNWQQMASNFKHSYAFAAVAVIRILALRIASALVNPALRQNVDPLAAMNMLTLFLGTHPLAYYGILDAQLPSLPVVPTPTSPTGDPVPLDTEPSNGTRDSEAQLEADDGKTEGTANRPVATESSGLASSASTTPPAAHPPLASTATTASEVDVSDPNWRALLQSLLVLQATINRDPAARDQHLFEIRASLQSRFTYHVVRPQVQQQAPVGTPPMSPNTQQHQTTASLSAPVSPPTARPSDPRFQQVQQQPQQAEAESVKAVENVQEERNGTGANGEGQR